MFSFASISSFAQEFGKYAKKFYMPPFDLNELEATREWFPDVDQPRMKELYGKWGGSIRLVLTRGGSADSTQNSRQLRYAVALTGVEQLRRALSGRSEEVKFPGSRFFPPPDISPCTEIFPTLSRTLQHSIRLTNGLDFSLKVCSGLLHHVPTSTFKDFELQFASRYMLDVAIAAMQDDKITEMRRFLEMGDGSFWRSLLEAFHISLARKRRRQGGSYRVKTIAGEWTDLVIESSRLPCKVSHHFLGFLQCLSFQAISFVYRWGPI